MKTLLQVAEKAPPADARELISRLANTNDRTIDITRALLELANSTRLETSEEVPLALIVGEEVNQLRGALLEGNIRVDAALDECAVLGHPVLVRLLVRNLLENAVRHNRPSGFVTVHVGRIAGGVALLVSNSGVTLDPAATQLLTEAFYRSNLRTASGASTGGHGLGLALVKSIAEAHEARLELSPGQPDGLIVTVIFGDYRFLRGSTHDS